MELVGSALRASPDLYPLAFDPLEDAVYLLQLNRPRYEQASFLDQRVAGPGDAGGWAPFATVAAAAAGLTGESDFIFHIGHVGSTLLSRLLGLSPRVFSLREPAALRTLADLTFDLPNPESLLSGPVFDERLAVYLRLLGRTYEPRQRTLIKATSFVGEMAAGLLQRLPSSRALLMTVPPEVYMATVLGGPASRVELKAQAQSRLRRLHRRIGASPWRLAELSEGERLAMSWAAEMGGPTEAAERFGDRVRWVDFEQLLAAPQDTLAATLDHLGADASPGELESMAKSPLFTRYSKGPEHAYDADLRRQVLDQARREHGGEISKGLAWLESAAAQSPAIGTLLDRRRA